MMANLPQDCDVDPRISSRITQQNTNRVKQEIQQQIRDIDELALGDHATNSKMLQPLHTTSIHIDQMTAPAS